jgi:Holliday junction resolvasome RuvABC endonuclease subunit
MKYIGLDLATATGWAFFEDDNLLERGTIQLISGMELPQKLHYLHLELDNLLKRLEPEYCFIEDVILAISGAKTLAYLARLNGVAINTAFSVLQERVKLYDPPYWKAHSFEGLGGMAKKWQVQLAVINHYGISVTGNFDVIQNDVDKTNQEIELKKQAAKDHRGEINKLKAKLNRKRDPLDSSSKTAVRSVIKELEGACKKQKDDAKALQKAFDKKMVKVSNDIAAQSGMTENICDACGIAYCGYKDVSGV